MKLNDFYGTSLEENLKQMDLIDFKVHSDDKGNVCAVEIKYRPKDFIEFDTKTGHNNYLR